MRFPLLALATPLLLAASALAGGNCKCQDGNGQYNADTEACCKIQGFTYHDDQVHQCTSNAGRLNSQEFVHCCQQKGRGGAYCWS